LIKRRKPEIDDAGKKRVRSGFTQFFQSVEILFEVRQKLFEKRRASIILDVLFAFRTG
jgi:hypothetical protein